ncbi:ATP-binding protein [Crenobacter luteus]|uniref:AAA family ATPase n=1 Tax=Crenobacter luteus TaxID=1452487 RepID=A0A161R593_9NEIS|nr:ATP-binding protein [Crenobacter luteus]KZE30027.1 AAA family ATPase [Crenobacter luteus]
MDKLEAFLSRAEQLLARLEPLLPPAVPEPDWSAHAFRWRRQGLAGWLEAVRSPHTIRLSSLTRVDHPKRELIRNTRQFLAGRPYNNVLLTGSRGTGKSSLVKALLAEYADEGLRLIEVDKGHLVDLPLIVDAVRERPERFILFCDDLSFEDGEDAYKALKTALDGGIAAQCDNLLVMATSNRRHLLPEKMSENLASQTIDGEIHPGEAIEEKVSLSDRFGLWLTFYPFDQGAYLDAVAAWLAHYGLAMDEGAERAALQWALTRGARSGRVAYQFARDWAGRDEAERKPLIPGAEA